MKVIKNKLLVFLLLLVLTFSCLMIPCSTSFASEINPKITIQVSPKVELLAIIKLLNADDYFACEFLNTIFKRDAIAWFLPYKNHSAVKTYQNLLDLGYTDQTLRIFLMELGNLPDMYFPEVLSGCNNTEIIKIWRDQLVSFCNESNFYTFWSRESDYYQQIIDQFVLESNVRESVKKEIMFLGITDFSVNFILSPLLQENQAILSCQSPIKEGQIILGLTGIQNGRLLFGDSATHQKLVEHDFLHLLVSSITKLFAEQINRSVSLFNPIQEKMEAMQIKSWNECFAKHISLSIQILCFEEDRGEKISEFTSLGFIYIPDTYSLLEQYQDYRDYFPTLPHFLPRILKQFDTIARRNQ